MSNYDNSARENREKVFNDKINHFSDHPKYKWLREYANEALHWDTCCGFYQIKADDFINRIIKADVDYINDWLDGKNQLEWSGIKEVTA